MANQIQGATGEVLVDLIAGAARDYRGTVELPTAEQASQWALSRTTVNGQHEGRWTLATAEDTRNAPRGCPALAKGAESWPYSKNYHPSLTALREIAATIRDS